MGSCFSKKKKQKTPPTNPSLSEKSPVPEYKPHLEENRSEAPLPVEEETVKEVLSETAKPSFPKAEEEKEEKETEAEEKAQILINGGDETSEVSDLCSLSESISTVTATEKKGEEGEDGEVVEMRRRESRSPAKYRRKRPAAGEFSARRDRGGKSPARRSEPSPGRRTPGRDLVQANRRRIPAERQGFRRDVGENSGRRSKSPATRTDRNAAPRGELGRIPSSRKTGRSPVRNPVGVAEDGGRKVVDSKEEDDGVASSTNESLENPLVSLECFIFL